MRTLSLAHCCYNMCSCRNVFEALTRDSEVPPRLFEEFSEGKYFYFSLINHTVVTPPCKLPVFLSDARAVDFAYE